MNSNNNPYIDPANNDSLVGSLRFAFQKMTQQLEGMLPAKVIAYDRTANRVQVQLLIALVGSDGTTYARPQIASIPVLVLGGGGFFLSFPLNVGDLGWVLANDRDISLFLQTYAQATPNTQRVMSFSDGVFIPDVMHNYTIDGADADSVVLSSLDGAVRIALHNPTVGLKQVVITAPDGVVVNGDLSVLGNLSATGFSVGSNLSMSESPAGTLHLTAGVGVANFTASGAITPAVPP